MNIQHNATFAPRVRRYLYSGVWTSYQLLLYCRLYCLFSGSMYLIQKNFDRIRLYTAGGQIAWAYFFHVCWVSSMYPDHVLLDNAMPR